ncbi:MAG: non-ribosomal peptide synthetase [Pasteurellaceae bacterium]|nr:non-ribosomal peptide synthetase [Pasteurellaceae bacterium]
MSKIDIIKKYLDEENIKGTKIFYGSCIETHSNSKDVDCCVITDQAVDEEFYVRYKKFLINNNFVIDEEVRYEDKLILNDTKINKALSNYMNQSEKFDLITDYADVVDRLIVNILTTKVKLVDDNGIYAEYSQRAWEKVLERFSNSGGRTFSDFIEIFKVNQDYKQYWGYSPKVINNLSNRFYQYTSNSDFIKLLKNNVIEHPQKIAVYSEVKNLTYEELDKLSDKVAVALLKFDSDYVIVNYSHRYELIPIIYGILKAGKVYIPVDNTSPLREIDLIRTKFINSIYISEVESDIDISKVFCSEHRLLDYLENNLAYIIHTSGTTGIPKGVCVTRSNLNYIMRGCQSFAPVTTDDCYLFSTRNTFDVSITEIFGFLYNGGSVYLYSVKNKDFYKELPNFINKFGITHIALSPSVLGILLKHTNQKALQNIDALKYLLIAGEEFKYELLTTVLEKLKKVQVFNVYGPTETTVYATYFNVRNTDMIFKTKNKVPIGKPLPGVKTLIVNGELLIGGQGVASGYYNDSQQTEARFQKIEGEVFYHTGDIVEELNSLFIYKGRKDSQVQIYGIRVELGDIRATISHIINDPERDIEVIFANNILMLFYTGSRINNLRSILEKEMLSYKVPAKYINMAEFPLTNNGKIDRKKLLEKADNYDHRMEILEEERTQDIVQNIASSIMNQTVEQDENLLDIGLDSLNSVEMILELEERFDINLDNLNLYIHSSVRKITDFIEEAKKAKSLKYNGLSLTKEEVKNTPLIREVDYIYPAFFYARIYNTLNFNSQLTGKIYLGKGQISYEEIYHKLAKIEVFKTVLSSDLTHFEVLDTPVNISKMVVEDAKVDVSEILQKLVRKSIEDRGLMYKFLLLESDRDSVLHYSIDHSICDSSSLDVLEKYILGIYTTSKNYSSYIKEIYARNSIADILKTIEKFDKQDDDRVEKLLTSLEDKIEFTSLRYINAETKNVYIEILLYLRTHLLEKYNIDNLKVNLIYNIRKFNECIDFTTTIGDLHLGLTFNLSLSIDIEESLENLIRFYQENIFNPKAIGYKHFPNLNSDETKIVNYFDDTVLVSVDYLGVVSRREFEKIKENALEVNNEINKLNGRKLNITAYIVDNHLELILSKNLNEK